MVYRDAFTHRAYPVNALSVSAPEESALNSMGVRIFRVHLMRLVYEVSTSQSRIARTGARVSCGLATQRPTSSPPNQHLLFVSLGNSAQFIKDSSYTSCLSSGIPYYVLK